MSESHLFNSADWFSVEQNQKHRMGAEIANFGSERILGSSVEDLCEYCEKAYWLDAPSLLKEQIVVDQQECDIDVSHEYRGYSFRGEPHFVKGAEIRITIPFCGEAELFKVQPTSFTLSPPSAEIRGNALILRVSGANLDGKNVRSQFDRTIAGIEGYLANLSTNAETYNKTIKAQARQLIDARRSRLLSNQNLVASLGFPLQERKGVSRTFAAPEIKRKIRPTLPSQGSQPFKPEPALTSDDYDHIIGVLENMALVMERSPSAFNSIDEESLRSHFLVQLNGHYEGQATGETFNYSGKTDIMVRVDGRNIFIGECKYWSGPKKLSETIDQLLSYSSWRDTKVALIVFNRQKNFTAVLQNIAPTVEKHPNYKRTLPINGETRFRFVLSHKDDPAREMIVTVLAFDVPNAEAQS